MLAHLGLMLATASDQINAGASAACGSSCNKGSLGTVFHNISNTLIFLIGGIAVIMIIIGGLRYVLSNGDPKGATDARNTILYSVIGLGVAISAYAIVNFVVAHF